MEKRYIVIPINDTKPTALYLIKNGKRPMYDINAAIDADSPKFYAYIDVTRFGDRELSLVDTDGNDVPFEYSSKHPTADEIPNGYYLRPSAHFTTTLGWTNDPNGLIFVNGLYHMFYQHNMAGTRWGNMTWGHAVSNDMVHWQELGDALFADKTGTMFSGSAICDERNVSGLGKNAILLYYTAAGNSSVLSKDAPFTQCMAYSVDGGMTFTKYKNNPVISHIVGSNRDPKVEWSPELGKYTLSLYLEGCRYAIFTSDDLLSWDMLREIEMPSDNECPDFYPLTLDGKTYWVFSGAHDTYVVGSIEDGNFVPCQRDLAYHITPGVSYAAQTFAGMGDRRVKIAWDRVSAPGAVFNSQMGIPTEMFLRRVGDDIRLGSYPVYEVERLKQRRVTVGEVPCDGALDVTVEIEDGCGAFTISCFGMTVSVDPDANTYTHGECRAPLSYDDKKNIRVIFDTLGLEVFADDGLVYSTMGQLADRSKGFELDGCKRLKYDAYLLKM